MFKPIIDTITIDIDIIEKVKESDIFTELESMYAPNTVIKDSQWKELCLKYKIKNNSFNNINAINAIIQLYHDIKDIDSSPTCNYVTSVQIKKDDLKVIDLFLISDQ